MTLQKKKLGFCPTMQDFAMNLAEKNDFEIINLGSAARVLAALNAGEVQLGLIGRIAKKNEFVGFLWRIGSGYTLIARTKGAIDQEQLPQLEIHTNVPEEVVRAKYPGFQHVIYHESLEDALQVGAVQLISWDDWRDEFELLIPVDAQNNKNGKFRTPHIYSAVDDLNNIHI